MVSKIFWKNLIEKIFRIIANGYKNILKTYGCLIFRIKMVAKYFENLMVAKYLQWLQLVAK